MLVESNAPHQRPSFVEKGTPYSEIPLYLEKILYTKQSNFSIR